MKRALGVAIAAIALISAGCSASSAPAANCLDVPTARAALILGPNSGLTVDKAGAVKSAEHRNAYYVAIRFSGPGVDKQVGVWAANALDSGPAFSVDAFAQEFSGLPKQAGFGTTDKGVEAARTCV